MTLTNIISGGQTGVDRAALDAAMDCGIAHGGWCPAGRRAEDGVIPKRYNLQETESADYHIRTQKNVINADATLILYHGELSGGTKLTHRFAVKHGRPFLLLDLLENISPAEIRDWLKENRIDTLNVAGPRESSAPGIAGQAYALLKSILGSKN